MPHTLPALLGALTTEPGRPRLTWYGADSERIELSGAVLVNWVSKTTNLLVEEFDAEPGTVVATDLPPHWRTLVWALATWRTGAHLATVGTADPADSAAPSPAPDVVVTATPDRWLDAGGARPRGTELVAVALPALARTFGTDLPAGTVDAASAVMTYGDQVGYVPPTDDSETALSGHGLGAEREVTHADLLAWARAQVEPVAPGDRVLVTVPAAPTGAAGVARVLAHALDAWASDGSVVLVSAEATAALEADPERLERLVATERVTARR